MRTDKKRQDRVFNKLSLKWRKEEKVAKLVFQNRQKKKAGRTVP
jgi:hypothetical protein